MKNKGHKEIAGKELYKMQKVPGTETSPRASRTKNKTKKTSFLVEILPKRCD
jgi:hypothetical protein